MSWFCRPFTPEERAIIAKQQPIERKRREERYLRYKPVRKKRKQELKQKQEQPRQKRELEHQRHQRIQNDLYRGIDERNTIRIESAILLGADVNEMDSNGETAKHKAIRETHKVINLSLIHI